MEIRIKGRNPGCPVWEITEKDGMYAMTQNGINTGTFDSLRIPLELMTVTFGITPWKETLVEAIRVIDGRNGIEHDDLENWSTAELVKYLAYGNKDADGVTGNWKPI